MVSRGLGFYTGFGGVYRASLGFGRNVCMVHRVEGFGHATPHTLYYALS